MKRAKTILLASLSLLSISLIATSVIASEKNVDVVFGFTNRDAATYYNGIPLTSGTELLAKLQELNDSKKKKEVGYNSMFTYFTKTDPGSGSNQVTAFYNGTSASKSQCNREHVWPDSHGGNVVEDDIHMVRPALKSDNNDRGNSFYVEGMNTQYDGWDPANCGNETYRGDSARIIFYCCVADSRLELLDVNKHHTTSEDNDYKMGRLSHLLRWNLEYPVTAREKTRNEAAESIQGNRNPFIDHPEYACKIWGNTNSETKALCASHGYSGTLDILSNNKVVEEIFLTVDEAKTFTSSITNGTANWRITNSSGAAIVGEPIVDLLSSGNQATLTALKEGSAYLNLEYTVNLSGGYTETLKKLVKINVSDKVRLTNLEIEYLPYRTSYYVGDEINLNGLKVNATFSDNQVVDVTEELTYSDLSLNEVGTKTITASYTYEEQSLSVQFDIEVKKKNVDPEPSPSRFGCKGSIISTSVILSTLSLIGIGSLLITKYRRKDK